MDSGLSILSDQRQCLAAAELIINLSTYSYIKQFVCMSVCSLTTRKERLPSNFQGSSRVRREDNFRCENFRGVTGRGQNFGFAAPRGEAFIYSFISATVDKTQLCHGMDGAGQP